MVKFIEVDPKEIPNVRESHRGRVSYPILKSFLETNKPLVQLDRTGIQQSLQGLTSCLNSYIRNHDLPIKMFTRKGEIYLMRTDLDDNGVPIQKQPETPEAEEDAPEVDAAEALRRFEIEKGQVTK